MYRESAETCKLKGDASVVAKFKEVTFLDRSSNSALVSGPVVGPSQMPTHLCSGQNLENQNMKFMHSDVPGKMSTSASRLRHLLYNT